MGVHRQVTKTRPIKLMNEYNEERGLTFREVYKLLGLHGKTSHTARCMAKKGQIRAIQINKRVTRYSLSSVMKLLEGSGETVP